MIDVVIVNWNSGDMLSNCVSSILNGNSDSIGKIIIVDNGSEDGSENLQIESNQVLLIKNPSNYGFAKSCNIGARHGKGEYVLFLNPDTVLEPDTLKRTINYMEKDSNEMVGISGIQLCYEDGNVARHSSRFPSPFSFFMRSSGLHKIFLSLDHVLTDWNHLDTREVPHVIGAYFFVRKQLYNSLNGFDERFFVYLEDLDFSLRAHRLGFKTHFISTIKSVHIAGGTSRQIKAKRLFYSLRSRIIYSYKHFNFLSATLILLSVIFIEPISRTIFSIKNLSLISIKNLSKSYALLFRWLFEWITSKFKSNQE
jgi:GT2 family glycosyltransferase